MDLVLNLARMQTRGEGVQNPENCVDVIYDGPQEEKAVGRKDCRPRRPVMLVNLMHVMRVEHSPALPLLPSSFFSPIIPHQGRDSFCRGCDNKRRFR